MTTFTLVWRKEAKLPENLELARAALLSPKSQPSIDVRAESNAAAHAHTQHTMHR